MKQSIPFIQKCVGTVFLAGVLLLALYGGSLSAADTVTANLKAIPGNAFPGSKIKFQASVYNIPGFYAKPGENIRLLVTQHNFDWISEKKDIQYPAAGNVHINFSNEFTIPATAKAGQVFKFALVNNIWWTMSDIVTVRVLGLQKKKDFIRKIKKNPKIIEKKTVKKIPVTE